MNNFGNQGQRLQSARPKIFNQQKRSEIAQLPLIANGKHGSQALQVDILYANVVMRSAS